MSLIHVTKAPKFNLELASYAAGKHAVKNWHYSQSMPLPPVIIYGVWEEDKFVGAVIFARGSAHNIQKTYDLDTSEVCELTRVAFSEHKTPLSRILSVALRKLKKSNKTLRLVVSYADPRHGHIGTIYQAGNWICTGSTKSGREFWKNGVLYSQRQVSSSGYNVQQGVRRRAVRPSECRVIKTPPKHRYFYCFDKAIKKVVLKDKKPYPKRTKQAMTAPAEQRRCDSDLYAPTITTGDFA